MASRKFDERERKKVVRELETALGITLSLVGRRRIYRADEAGRRYLILGGYGEWHGVPSEIVEAEERLGNDRRASPGTNGGGTGEERQSGLLEGNRQYPAGSVSRPDSYVYPRPIGGFQRRHQVQIVDGRS